jgi:hypothetical protein
MRSTLVETAPDPEATRPNSRWLGRVAGTGGLAFVVLLVVQNALRSSEPGADAAPAKVVQFFTDDRAKAVIPLGLFPLGMLALSAFVAGVWLRAESSQRTGAWWARVGVLGAAMVAALFALVNVTDLVLVARPGGAGLSHALVRVLWTLHNAAFALNLAAIGTALVGLGMAAVACGLAPRWVAWTSGIGAALLVVPAVFAVAIVNGGPWTGVAIGGFVLWVVFVVVTSIGLWRRA